MQAGRGWLAFSHFLCRSSICGLRQHRLHVDKRYLLPLPCLSAPPETMRPACALPPCSGGLSRTISNAAHIAQWPAQMSRHGGTRRGPGLAHTTCNTLPWLAPPPTHEAILPRTCTAASSTSSVASTAPLTHARTSHIDASPAAGAEQQREQQPNGHQVQAQQPRSTPAVQPVDFSTLAASCAELRERWVPAKVEQVRMCACQSALVPFGAGRSSGPRRSRERRRVGRAPMRPLGHIPFAIHAIRTAPGPWIPSRTVGRLSPRASLPHRRTFLLAPLPRLPPVARQHHTSTTCPLPPSPPNRTPFPVPRSSCRKRPACVCGCARPPPPAGCGCAGTPWRGGWRPWAPGRRRSGARRRSCTHWRSRWGLEWAYAPARHR